MSSTLTAAELIAALGRATFMAIFDDDDSNDPDEVSASDGVQAVIEDTDAEIGSWVENIYPGADIPASTSKLIMAARRRYAVLLSYRRHTEYVKTYGAEPGGELMKEHVERMERIQKSIQRIPAKDTPPTPAPANVGVRLSSGDPDKPLCKPKFLGGTGDY